MTFYKMYLSVYDNKMCVETDEFVPVHESPCFYYCIDSRTAAYFARLQDGESVFKTAKKHGVKLRRIGKDGSSRFAFPTKEKAFKHLVFLKSRQLQHVKYTLKYLELFLKDPSKFDMQVKIDPIFIER